MADGSSNLKFDFNIISRNMVESNSILYIFVGLWYQPICIIELDKPHILT